MRLRLIAVLCVGGAMSITQLTAGTDITRQAVTKHLNVLAAAGLVRDVKVGRERLWEFEPAQLDEARRTLEMIGRQWDNALERLRVGRRRMMRQRRADPGRFLAAPFGASKPGKLLYNPRALSIRFAWDPSVGRKNYDWRCNLLIYKRP